MANYTIEIRNLETTYILASHPNDNYNDKNRLVVTPSNQILLKVDQLNIPPDATIINAVLKTSIEQADPIMSVNVYEIIEEWQADTVTYNSRPNINLIKNNAFNFPTVPPNSSQLFDVNITQYMSYIKNKGIAFLTQTSNSYCWLTKSSTYIELTYTTDKPQPPTPTTPLNGTVLNKNVTPTVRFEWTSTNQALYEFQYSTDRISYNTVTGTTNKYHDLNITAMPEGNLFWHVRYTDTKGLQSIYTPTILCKVGVRPVTPTVTFEYNKISWDKNDNQVKYQVTIFDGSTLVEDSKLVYSNDNQYFLTSTLENSKTYTAKVKIIDNKGIESLEGINTLTTNFVEPLEPNIQLISNNDIGTITIKCIKQTTGEVITKFEIFRKEVNGQFNKIVTDITNEYIDFKIVNDTTYIYKARGFTASGGYKDSKEAHTKAILPYSQLTVVSNFNYITLKYNPRRNLNLKQESTQINYSGRLYPVTEYGEHETNNISLSFIVEGLDNLNNLIGIFKAKETVLYRDNRNKFYYCTINNLSAEDGKIIDQYNVSFVLNRVDYQEVVT